VPPAHPAQAVLPDYPNAFVDRETDLAALRAIGTPAADVGTPGGVPLPPQGPRLLTLIGRPGCGKTRLAVALAADVAGAYREGARFMDLAGLTDPDGVTRAVARAIGLAAWPGPALLDPLIAALQSQQILLVLDGAEQALDPCATFVDAVLRRCPTVQLVVTSREPLQIEGERVWRVGPLALPAATVAVGAGGARRATLPAIRASAAVRLFADRAARIEPTFAVSLANAGPLDAICRALGGVPLALELAAAQIGSLTLPDLAAQLAALPPEQPLAGAIAWSYRRLAPADSALLRSLAPFVGGWPEAVATFCERLTCDDPASVCERLTCDDVTSEGLRRLIATGLVQREHREGACSYRLPRPIRAYVLAQLRAAGAETAAYASHLAWCRALAHGAAVRATSGAARGAADERVTAADDNLCHALIWALDHDPEGGRRLAAALYRYWLAVQPGATGWARLLPLLERVASPTPLVVPDPSSASG